MSDIGSTRHTSFRATTFAALALTSLACGEKGDRDLIRDLEARQPFIPVYRDGGEGIGDSLQMASALRHAPRGMMEEGGRSFYLAIRRDHLARSWFLSAYLKHHLPGQAAEGSAASSLGVRVVSFRLANGRLYVLDVDNRKRSSDLFDPELLIEAFPVVTGYPAFEKLEGADRYVLIDPAIGLNRFSVETDSGRLANGGRFTIELAIAQRFRAIEDGITFEKMFTGYADQPLVNSDLTEPSPLYRGSGVLSLAIRSYEEGPGFQPRPLPRVRHYFGGPPRLVLNEGRTEQVSTKWNIKRGMKPIRWLVIGTENLVAGSPQYQAFDIYAAIKTGIESWNEVFGFPVFAVERAGRDDQIGEDDKNLFIYDKMPSAGGFANTRVNPNTGEIRGASVYLGSQWFDLARAAFAARPAAPAATPQAPSAPAPATETEPADVPGAPASRLWFSWAGMASEPLCQDDVPPLAAAADSPAERLAIAMLSEKERIERAITQTAAHEVGHTLGLRHNFKGSLMPPSSTVMDYMSVEGKAASPRPGPYDVAAIRYLYNLTEALPSEPFCTDGQNLADPLCTQRDFGADPLNDFHSPTYVAALDAYLAQGQAASRARLEAAATNLMFFVRASPSSEQRLNAWRIALERVRLAVPPGADAARVDLAARTLVTRLFPDPPPPAPAGTPAPTAPTSIFFTPFPADPMLSQEVALELKANVLATAPVRTPPTRRVSVTGLKRMQTVEAYRALREARVQLALGLPQLTGDEQVVVEDLVSRIDEALTPYFN